MDLQRRVGTQAGGRPKIILTIRMRIMACKDFTTWPGNSFEQLNTDMNSQMRCKYGHPIFVKVHHYMEVASI